MSKFILSMVVYFLAAWWLNSVWLAFLMALGFMILLALAESYLIDWLDRRKNRR